VANGWREVESRIAFEKSNRLERKAHIFNWHHWKIFRSWEVKYTDRVPKHNVSVYQWSILKNPFRQTGSTFVLAYILTWCMQLIWIVSGNPEIMVNKSGTPHEG